MGAKIHLYDDWWLRSDRRNYILSKYRGKDKKGKDMFDNYAFCDTIPFLIKKIKDFEIKTSDANNLEELLEVSKKIDKKIDRVLGGIDPKIKKELENEKKY